jgi:hypothetical protein
LGDSVNSIDHNPGSSIGRGHFLYQCIVRIELREPLGGEDSEGRPLSPAIGYFRTFGVTARGAADAVASAITHLGRLPECSDTPAGGHLHHLWLVAASPDEIDHSRIDCPLDKPGVWFTSWRIYFNDSEDAFQEAASMAREVLSPESDDGENGDLASGEV